MEDPQEKSIGFGDQLDLVIYNATQELKKEIREVKKEEEDIKKVLKDIRSVTDLLWRIILGVVITFFLWMYF